MSDVPADADAVADVMAAYGASPVTAPPARLSVAPEGWNPAPPPVAPVPEPAKPELPPNAALLMDERAVLLKIALIDPEGPLRLDERGILLKIALRDTPLSTATLMFEGVDLTKAPTYTVKEAGKFFFHKSPSWMRWREKRHLKGDDMPEMVNGNRRYSLDAIERIAHALSKTTALDDSQLLTTLKMLALTAHGHGIKVNAVEFEKPPV